MRRHTRVTSAGKARLPFAAPAQDGIFDEHWNREQTSAGMSIPAVCAARSCDGAAQWRCLVRCWRNVRITSVPGSELACSPPTREVARALEIDGNTLPIGNRGLSRQGAVLTGRGSSTRVPSVRGFNLDGRCRTSGRARGSRNRIISAQRERDDKMAGRQHGHEWGRRRAPRVLRQ